MSGQERSNALHEVTSGRRIKDFRVRGCGVALKGLREGVVDPSSPLADEHALLFVSTNSNANPNSRNFEEAALSLAKKDDGTVEIGLETRRDGVENNVVYLREFITGAMRASQLYDVTLVAEANALSVSPETLENLGFHEANGHYESKAFAA